MAYLDGELPLERAAAVQAHVVGCDGCQRLSGELRGVSRDHGAWQVEDAPATSAGAEATRRQREHVRDRASVGFAPDPALAYSLAASVGCGWVVLPSLAYGRLLSQTQPVEMPLRRRATCPSRPRVELELLSAPVAGWRSRHRVQAARATSAGAGVNAARPRPLQSPAPLDCASVTTDFDAARRCRRPCRRPTLDGLVQPQCEGLGDPRRRAVADGDAPHSGELVWMPPSRPSRRSALSSRSRRAATM